MKKHRKIQKKQETELYVQVAEKPENQKENVGEALACFCIYVGWYLMVMQFCRSCKWTKRKEIHTKNRA